MEMIMQQENETKDNTKGQIKDNKKAAQVDSEVEHKNTNNQNYSSTRNQQNPGRGKTETEDNDREEEGNTIKNTEQDGDSTLSNSSSYMQNKFWDDITLNREHSDILQATKEQIRKVTNTLEKYDISPSEIERWKNNNWLTMEVLIKESKSKEYSVMKKMVENIQRE